MNAQLLIYQNAVPITRHRHAGCFVNAGMTYAFSGEVNSVPLLAAEFSPAADEYAIIFSGSETEVVPAVLLGVRAKENLFVSEDGGWNANYIPAFIRRYPFVFSRSGDHFVLCVDEACPGFNRDGRGKALFSEDGETTPFVGNMIRFLQEYQALHLRTRRFCARLTGLGLLEPMRAQVMAGDTERISLVGFKVVNRDKLKALPGDTLAELAKADELDLIYLHLRSLRNMDDLRERLGFRMNVAKTVGNVDAGPAQSR